MNNKIRRIGAYLCIVSIVLGLWCVSASAFSTGESIELKLTSRNVGNVFFDGDVPAVDILLKNSDTQERSFIIEYSIQRKNLDTSESFTELVPNTNYRTETISSGESIKIVFRYNEKLDYGIYNLNILIKDVENPTEILCTREMEFSKVIRNDTQNPHHGVCVHLVRMGDAETELSFAKNAGFSMVRDDFTWGEYELAKGIKKLSPRHRNFLKKAGKYNLDVLAIVGGNNQLYYESGEKVYPLPTNLNEFKNFVSSLLNEDEFKAVKRIEVNNEPQGGYILKDENGRYLGQDIETLAPQYAEQLMAASSVIRAERPEIEIGAFSLCLMADRQTDEYINEVYKYLEKNYTGEEKLFDTITIHPYNVRSPEASTVGETVEHYKGVAKQNGFNAENTDIWVSEYGIATGNSVSQLNQAKRIIHDYAEMKSDRYTDELYIYDMADDSGTYGLIRHSTNATVPYAAKLSYLAVSALNKMTGGANNCTEFKDENNLFDVYDFSYADGNVYMIYPKDEGTETLEYTFGSGNLTYYDMLGNEIDEAKSDEYFKAGNPYYVMRNMKLLPTENNVFTISGNIRTGKANKNVSLTVLKEQTKFDGNMYGKILYAEQKKTEYEGSFEFKFDVEDKSDNFVGYIVSEDDETPLTFELKGDIKALRLYSGATEINSLNMDLLDLSDAKVKVNFSEIGEVSEFSLICGFYNDDKLVYTKICEGDGNDTYDISANDSFDYDAVKIFMFDSLTKCIPLCTATMIGQN